MFARLILLPLLALVPVQDRETVRQSEEHFARGVELQHRGDLEHARLAYEAALQLIPRRTDALSNLGVVLVKLGFYQQAISRYQEALAIDPSEHGIRLNLGLAYYQTDQYQQALSQFEAVLQAQPDNMQARFLLGVCLFEAGRMKEAVAELEGVYAARPEEVSVAYALANAYLQNEQIEKGQKLVDRVFRELNSSESSLIIGSFSLARNELRAAVEELKQAVRLNPR